MDIEESLKEIAEMLLELNEDKSIPRNIKRGAKEAATEWLLNTSKDVDVRIFSAISILEEQVDDPNIPLHARTQIYNIITQLETLNASLH